MKALSLAVLALLSACASAPDPAPSGPPVLALKSGLPAPPQARLYADCIAQAAETGSYEREAGGKTLRFTCSGATAKWFFDGLQQWSAESGSAYVDGGRKWRFSKKLIEDSSGIDGCWMDGAGEYQCVVILAVGEFIEQLDYRIPKP